jgi:choice-of-anchor C domain-containing protein
MLAISMAGLGLFMIPAKAATLTLGNAPIDRAVVDTYSNFSIIDTNNPAAMDGTINKVEFYAKNTNPFKFLIVDNTGIVKWKSELITPSTMGVHTYYIPTQKPEVLVGWNIGMYFQQTGTIPFDYASEADSAYYETNNAGEPTIGELLTVAGNSKRYYSLLASGLNFSNGSFEREVVSNPFTTKSSGNTTIPHWIIGASIDHIRNYWTASEGSQSIDLNALSSGSISQTFDTTPGVTYVFSFDLSGNPTVHSSCMVPEKILTVTANSKDLVSYTYDTSISKNTVGAMNWVKEYYIFTAEEDKTTLQFSSNTTGACGPALDNVSLESYADRDKDNDGVLDDQDMCDDTLPDDNTWSSGSLGINRWEVRINSGNPLQLSWYQNQPVKKGMPPNLTPGHEISYSCGCNGHQILGILGQGLNENFMNGHQKYGLSSSILNDFSLDCHDGNIDGRYFIETVTVPANKADNTQTANILEEGKDYFFKARGTANAGDGIVFDAKYSYRTPTSTTWTDSVSTYEGYGPQLLDLFLNDSSINWGGYNGTNEYEYHFIGVNARANFKIYDIYYPNNTGNLYVDVYQEI